MILGTQAAEMAGLLVDLVSETGSTRVPRSVIREEWSVMFPEHDVGRPVSATSAAARRPARFDEQPHSKGSKGKARVLNAVVELEREGWVRRDGDVVVVLDVPALQRLAENDLIT
ncbi:hypothetical protein DMP17_44280 [Pseudonocardia sp. TMWB2A]|uniref:hypothetical protein n=1 Tax=Pseudonocardia sp. TMWB2A TaxID=687430 RepID=UPI00307D4FDC